MIGYAVMMTRTVLKQPIAFPALLRSLLPYLLAQAALLLAVLLLPRAHHVGETAADRSRKPPAISDRDLEKRFEQMLPPIEPTPDVTSLANKINGAGTGPAPLVQLKFCVSSSDDCGS